MLERVWLLDKQHSLSCLPIICGQQRGLLSVPCPCIQKLSFWQVTASLDPEMVREVLELTSTNSSHEGHHDL